MTANMKLLPDHEIYWPKKVRTARNAAKFIDAMGFCMLFAVKNVALPSLYYAVRRGKKFAWDAEMERLWGWKDELPRRKLAFYGKYFKTRGTFISLKLLPHFLADRGSPTVPGDAERFYAAGRIRHDAMLIWQALAEHGALATLELRHACKMDSQAGNKRYKKAMLELQCLLAVAHFGTEQETAAWASGKFELTARAFRKQVAAAGGISPEAARAALAAKYLEMYPSAALMQVARLFGWSKVDAQAAVSRAERKTKT